MDYIKNINGITAEIEKRFMAMVKKLRSAYSLCCSSDAISSVERDYIHFYFAVRAIVHKLTKGEAPDAAQMNERVQKMILISGRCPEAERQ